MENTNQKDWTFILNPHAGGSKGHRDQKVIETLLRDAGLSFKRYISEYPEHAILLVKEAVENGTRQIIVAGGDGTLNEVVNGLFQQKSCSPSDVSIGMIPVGTGNDWIKTFGIPNDYKGAIQKIVEGKTFFQDVGKLCHTEDGKEHARYFSNMAGFGFDAMVANKANRLKEKNRSGLSVYFQSLLSAFVQYQTRKVKILIDGIQVENLIFSVSVGIGKYNGGGMMQSPGAIPDNGFFEVTLIKKIGLWGILTNLVGLYNGNYIKDKRVSSYRAKEVSISSENPLSGEVDGESLGKYQFHIELLPKELKVIVGEDLLKRALE